MLCGWCVVVAFSLLLCWNSETFSIENWNYVPISLYTHKKYVYSYRARFMYCSIHLKVRPKPFNWKNISIDLFVLKSIFVCACFTKTFHLLQITELYVYDIMIFIAVIVQVNKFGEKKLWYFISFIYKITNLPSS